MRKAKTLLSLVARMGACAALLPCVPAAAQAPTLGASPTLIHVDNGNPALVTDRHLAAQAAGYRALHYCSGVFSVGLPDTLLEESISSRASRDARTVIDREKKIVSVYYASDMEPRIAAWRPGLGCAQLPIGATVDLVARLPRLPDSVIVPSFDDRKWPMGDVDATAGLSKAKSAAVAAVLDEAFRNDAGTYRGHTWGVVVVKDGRIVAERYESGWGPHTAARTNSMCKSVGVSLVGLGVRTGLVDLSKKAPLKAWQTPGDPRGNITLNDLLHMASGLYTDAGGDPQRDIYDAGAPPSEVSMLNMVDSRPGARFLYAGSDTILAGRSVREALNDDAKWLALPYREFLWKLGMTRTVVETDWRGDFLLSGQCWSTARDFGRFGMLYLADGVWNGERLLPEGWSKYVSTLAPAQPASYFKGGPGYGAQFWVHNGREGLPDVAYAADGAGGQYAMIVPSANLVVVRRGLDVESNFNVAKFSADVLKALADPSPAVAPQAGAKGDQQRHYFFDAAGKEMPYRLYVPSGYDARAGAPLIVALHGYGGTQDYFFDAVKDLPTLCEQFGAIFVAPMGFATDGWYGAPLNIPGAAPRSGGGATPTTGRDPEQETQYRALSEQDVLNVLEIVKREYRIDPRRIYLMGHSMGGFGTWWLGQKHADIWAAIAPMSGVLPNVDYQLPRLKNVPVMVSIGGAENPAWVEASRKQIDAMQALGMTTAYFEPAGATHGGMIAPTTPRAFEFLAKQRKER